MKITGWPKIRHDERMKLDDGLAVIHDHVRMLTRADVMLRMKIAIVYPPLPEGYVWERQVKTDLDLDALSGSMWIRYVPRHTDDLGPGAVFFRP